MASNGPKLKSPNSKDKTQDSFELIKEDLECPVCRDVPKSLPIYQCLQGHIICNSCYPKLNNCPVCRVILSPQIRALTAEKILQKHRDVSYNSGPVLPAGHKPDGVGPAGDRDAQHNQFHQITAQPMPILKEWQAQYSVDLRNHMFRRVVETIFPSPDQQAMLDPRMHNLIAYARQVEADCFEMANSRSEYYQKLAEKMYKIQKELEKKREQRRRHAGQAGQPNGPGPAN